MAGVLPGCISPGFLKSRPQFPIQFQFPNSTVVGVRDVILPGDMKDLMDKVMGANLIVGREETAAMRSQANTAKLLEGSPTLMRLRELEVLEKVSAGGKLNVVLGEKGLAERVVNLL